MSERVSDAGYGLRAWVIWSLAASAFALAFFLRVSPSVMSDDLMREFAVGAAVLGNLSAIYFYIYAGSQIPIGAMMDRWGPRAMISVSVALAAAGTVLFALADGLTTAYLGRFLIGAGSACAFVGGLVLAGRWFPPQRYAFVSGMTMLFGMAGGLLGQAPLALLIEATDWRQAMLLTAAVAGALAALIWLVVRDRPPAPSSASGSVAGGGAIRSIGSTLGNIRLWCVMAIGASFSGPLLAFGGLWGVPYMMVKYGLDRPDAAFYVSFNLIGWALGAPFGGWLSDHLGRRKAPLLVVGVINLACMAALFYLPALPPAAAAVLIFLIGALSGTMVITYALGREITPPASHGTVTGFINMGTVGAGAVLQPIIGLVLDLEWDGTVVDGVRAYGIAAYTSAFVCLMVWAALGVAFTLLLRETYCRPQVA